MTEEIRDLIEKINQDGIRAAEEKGRAIEASAHQRADEILVRATREAEEMIAAAKDRVRREDETGKALLAQAGRDLLLSLREEINAMLGRIVAAEVRKTLTPERLAQLISEAARNSGMGEGSDVIVELNKKDREVLEEHFLCRLSGEVKKSVILRPSGAVTGGFTISFDEGRSCFDFTDAALAEYIGTVLKPKLHRILQDAIKE